jgi:hypothetical protein
LDSIVSKIELYLGDDAKPLIVYGNSGNYAKLESINNQHKFWLNDSVKNIIASFTSDSKSEEIDKEIDEEMINTLRGEESLTKERILEIINISKEKKKKLCKEEKLPFCYREFDLLSLDKYLPIALNNHSIGELISHYSGYGLDDAGNLSLITLAAAELFRQFLMKVQYIGPLRENPERYFTFSGTRTEYVGKSGKSTTDLLITNKELKDKVNLWFKRLDIGYELKVPRLSDPDSDIHDVFALRLFDNSNGVYVGITDVGFGVSQVLPVIVQSVISEGKTILIEQPEYHLHPKLQAELGDMFIESALGGQGNTFLIETHSEHLILRILRRIRETAEGTLPEGLPPIKPEDVAVLYVQPGDNGSRIINIPVNEEGYFDRPWPEGFFAERARELF